jgi:hypothetical protein
MPSDLATEGKIRDVFLAIRDAGGYGATQIEIAETTGQGATRIAPILFVLDRAGYVLRAGTRGEVARWQMPIYLTPHAARALGPALNRKDI